ncbi:glycosyltransferase [Brevundimonas sp. KM4]|uniref:glycosyltransferase n=1 Tax=Brevundimonas sp. KM4 TaxID=1628191 RepID=UPI0009E4778D|nr:glycosyltransferase [Brevundimonas sp. KM4]
MKTLLFVDHAFHTSTSSSQFFIDLLKRRFDVTIVHINPPSNIAEETILRARSADVVVIWQMDYIAPVFLAIGVPTIVIPMYDGSAAMPDLHWIWSSKAHYVNFSFTLHHRIAGLGNQSFLARYFTPVVAQNERATFESGLKAFLWQRRPEHGINAPAVMKLLDGQIKSLHVHNAPDDPDLDTRPYKVPSNSSCAVTQTSWFPKAADYHAALSQANVFIAPRRAEGIGMALLEAMSRGMLVVACDEPTHNEYIANWQNGILYNPDSSQSVNVSLDEARSLGRLAYETAVIGRQNWELQALEILEIVDNCEAPEEVNLPSISDFSRALSTSYYSGITAYTAFMLNHADLIATMSGHRIKDYLPFGSSHATAHEIAGQELHDAPWLETSRVPVAGGRIKPYVATGRLEYAGGTAWITGHSCELRFRTDPLANSISSLKLGVVVPAEINNQSLIVTLNGWTLGIKDIPSGSSEVWFDLPLHVQRGSNLLRLQATIVCQGVADDHLVSLGLDEILLS